jgi:RNA polymerase sigma factor (sigma-70 family)
MMQSHVNDETLISTGLRGNEQALDTLFARHRRLLHSLAVRILHNHEEAEDAVQNCMVLAFRNLPKFENHGAFRTWLVRILINEAIAILRKKKARPQIVSEPAVNEKPGEWLDRFPSPGPNPEQAFANRESVAALTKRLVRLSSPMRSAILLCYIGEHSPAEAGKVLGVTANTVKIRLFRARRKLQQQMLVPSNQWNSQISLGTQAETIISGMHRLPCCFKAPPR